MSVKVSNRSATVRRNRSECRIYPWMCRAVILRPVGHSVLANSVSAHAIDPATATLTLADSNQLPFFG